MLSKAEADNTNRGLNNSSYLREPNLFFHLFVNIPFKIGDSFLLNKPFVFPDPPLSAKPA